jgi:hypothetical protein
MLREILARFGIRVDTAPLTGANAATQGFIGNLKLMGGLLAGGLIVRGLRNFVTEMINLGDDTAKSARQLGISARELAGWQFAANRAGVEGSQLVNGFRRLQRNIVDANEGLSTAVRAFDSLGVSTKDAEGNARELLDIMPQLADAFVGLSTATERSARAQQIFGRAGAQLLPFFEEGSEGIQEMLERFERLGIGLEDDFFGSAEVAQDALADFDLAMSGLKATIATDILPAVSRFAVTVAELVADFNSATEETGVWQAALIALGAVAVAVGIAMLAAFIEPIAAILLIAAVIFLLVLAVDDFLTFMEGGDSVIGEFFRSLGINVDKARGGFQRFFDDQKLFWGEEFPKFLNNAGTEISTFADLFVEVWGKAFDDVGQFLTRVKDDFLQFWTIDVPEAISSALSFIGTSVDAVTDFLGLARVGSTAPTAAPAARVPGVAPRGGANANIQQDVSVTIDNRGGGDPRGVEGAVREAVAKANQSAIRNAQRALTQVVD